MKRILHLVDDADPHELRLSLDPLLQRLPSSTWQQQVAMLSGRLPVGSMASSGAAQRLPLRLGLHFLTAPTIRRYLELQRIDLIHAWSHDGAYAAFLASRGDFPIAVTLWDPHLPAPARSRVQCFNGNARLGVLCQAQMVKRRLVESGVAVDQCAVIRPGIDFSRINQLRRDHHLREDIGIPAGAHTVVMPPLTNRRVAFLSGLWSAALIERLGVHLHVLVPGRSPFRRRLLHCAKQIHALDYLFTTGDDHAFESLLSIADVLLVPTSEDIPTTSIAWAMASKVPILGSAVYSIAEFIADSHNGYLVKPRADMALARRLKDLLDNRRQHIDVCETARRQAFESFGLTRYVQQVEHAYEMLLAGRRIGPEVTDAAVDA